MAHTLQLTDLSRTTILSNLQIYPERRSCTRLQIGKQKYKQRVRTRGWGDKNRSGAAGRHRRGPMALHVVSVAGSPAPGPYLRERGRRPADDVRGHSGAATDAQAGRGRIGTRRHTAGRQ